ncbi:MAG: hypothetical protein SwBeaMacB_13510 [Shewanella algae]
MARKPKNPDIGEITCPICGEVAPVRRDSNGKLYYISSAGMIKPNLPGGQDWMLENANIWSKEHKPKPVTEAPKTEPVTEQVPVTEPEVIPAVNIPKIPPKTPPVPVNGYKGQKPVNEADSKTDKQPPKSTLLEWLIG